MKLENIEVNTQSSMRMEFDKVIYFDPYKIDCEKHDADIIFITHNHYDHMDSDSINKIKNESTIIVAPETMKDVVSSIECKDYIFLNQNEEISIDSIKIKTIPAYNIQKPFHPRSNNWLGYIITYNDISYYIAGDTDKTKEAEAVECDVAIVPIGGHYTMDVNEATELIKAINPKVVIPTHYGSIIGDANDGKILKDNLSDTNIEVIEKLKF